MGKFKPKLGQVDYTRIRYAPVINCVVAHKGKILLVRRSPKLKLYPGYWNGISGFLDDHRSIEEKARDEAREELGLKANDVISIRVGQVFDHEEPKYKKTWIVHPVLVRVRNDKIKLGWEASDYKWIEPAKAKKLKLVPGFNQVLGKLSEWLRR